MCSCSFRSPVPSPLQLSLVRDVLTRLEKHLLILEKSQEADTVRCCCFALELSWKLDNLISWRFDALAAIAESTVIAVIAGYFSQVDHNLLQNSSNNDGHNEVGDSTQNYLKALALLSEILTTSYSMNPEPLQIRHVVFNTSA